jgi:hypothetical protein
VLDSVDKAAEERGLVVPASSATAVENMGVAIVLTVAYSKVIARESESCVFAEEVDAASALGGDASKAATAFLGAVGAVIEVDAISSPANMGLRFNNQRHCFETSNLWQMNRCLRLSNSSCCCYGTFDHWHSNRSIRLNNN